MVRQNFNEMQVSAMLVLSRKPGERILIGPKIEVVVVEITVDKVKLGFECPQDVRVLREELQWHSIPQQTKASAHSVKSTFGRRDFQPTKRLF